LKLIFDETTSHSSMSPSIHLIYFSLNLKCFHPHTLATLLTLTTSIKHVAWLSLSERLSSQRVGPL